MFNLLITIIAILAGGIASVTGFGIGSLLTPALALRVDTKVAVAAVSIPHLIGTAVRFWRLRGHVDRSVLWGFGLASAAGGLTGALLHSSATNPGLSVIFGALLLFVAAGELTGLARRMHFTGPLSWIAGSLSGLLGGLVGNQGGIRSAALLGFDMPKETFVATATAIGLFVDAARMPVYFAVEWRAILTIWPVVSLATAGVVAGTVGGARLLDRIPERWFRRVLALVIGTLGAVMLIRGLRG